MKNYFFKPELENLSQCARLKFVRKLRYMSKPNVAEFLELGGEKTTDSIDKYERNAREPQPERLDDRIAIGVPKYIWSKKIYLLNV